MNFKTLAVSTAMLASSIAGHSQSVARDSIRMANPKTVTTIIQTTTTGGEGLVKYAESLRIFPEAVEQASKAKTEVKYGMHYLGAEKMASPAGGFDLTAKKGNTSIITSGDFGRKPGHTHGLLKGHVQLDHPLSEDFSVGGRVGINGMIEKINGDFKGGIAPEASVVGTFLHKADNGVRVGADASVGGAINFVHDNCVYNHKRNNLTGQLNALVGYKAVDLHAGVGQDVHAGKYFNAGVRYTF